MRNLPQGCNPLGGRSCSLDRGKRRVAEIDGLTPCQCDPTQDRQHTTILSEVAKRESCLETELFL